MVLRELHAFICRLPGVTLKRIMADISRVEFENGLAVVTSMTGRGDESTVSVQISRMDAIGPEEVHSFPLNSPMDILLFIFFNLQRLHRDTGVTLENEFFSRVTFENESVSREETP